MSDAKQIDENELGVLSAMTMGQEPEEKTEIPEDYVVYAGKALPENEKPAAKEDIIEALKTVCDPEISINIYDMGLIYDIRQDELGNVDIDMTLTAPGCPVAGVLPQQAADVVALVEGVGKVSVKLVWEPAWSFERLSEEARAMMELL